MTKKILFLKSRYIEYPMFISYALSFSITTDSFAAIRFWWANRRRFIENFDQRSLHFDRCWFVQILVESKMIIDLLDFRRHFIRKCWNRHARAFIAYLDDAKNAFESISTRLARRFPHFTIKTNSIVLFASRSCIFASINFIFDRYQSIWSYCTSNGKVFVFAQSNKWIEYE